MTRIIKFTKMHGAGNDYIYVDTTRYPIGKALERVERTAYGNRQ